MFHVEDYLNHDQSVNVAKAVEGVEELLLHAASQPIDADTRPKDVMLDALHKPSPEQAYLNQREELLGQLPSAELLAQDEAAGFWPDHLDSGDDADVTTKQMLFVDELSWCVPSNAACDSPHRRTAALP